MSVLKKVGKVVLAVAGTAAIVAVGMWASSKDDVVADTTTDTVDADEASAATTE